MKETGLVKYIACIAPLVMPFLIGCGNGANLEQICNPQGKWWLVTPPSVAWDNEWIGTYDTMSMTQKQPSQQEPRYLSWEFVDSMNIRCFWANGNVGKDTVIDGDTALGLSSFAAAGGEHRYRVNKDTLTIELDTARLRYQIFQCKENSFVVVRIK